MRGRVCDMTETPFMPDIACAICGWDGTLYMQHDGRWLCDDCQAGDPA